MDAFEKLIKMDGLDPEEHAQKMKELEEDCVCPICPTYEDCGKGENVFCITEKSSCVDMELGCLCPTCPLAQKYKIGVMYNFYCTRGSEKDQRLG
ncbi:MAG: DUF2769 domain-containing protein [Methanobacteriaceae archaeon]|nr:DUF2769 domain-containing protein [Methanobacteriaceae archaeon]